MCRSITLVTFFALCVASCGEAPLDARAFTGHLQEVGGAFCNGARTVCVDLNVAGNSGRQSTRNLWPLKRGNAWRFHGVTRKFGRHQTYKTQFKIEAPFVYEGQLATPVDIVKNRNAGYWAPGVNDNVRWMVVDFDQGHSLPYMWARGDKRYKRDVPLEDAYYRRFRYDSLTSLPPYVILPRYLEANPGNDGLVNSFLSRHQYSSCQKPENCSLNLRPGHISWFSGIVNARIKVPAFGNAWVAAKRVEFAEVSLPGGWNDGLSDPYRDDRAFACRRNGDEMYYRGVREDWFFVPNVGISLIITRDIGLAPDEECVYDVARQNLTFGRSDSYLYLVEWDGEGYDPTWSF